MPGDKKIPGPSFDPGMSLFYPQDPTVASCPRGVPSLSRQVFWLPFLPGGLPVLQLIEVNNTMSNALSQTVARVAERFPFHNEKERVTAAGPSPSFTGFPIKLHEHPNMKFFKQIWTAKSIENCFGADDFFGYESRAGSDYVILVVTRPNHDADSIVAVKRAAISTNSLRAPRQSPVIPPIFFLQ